MVSTKRALAVVLAVVVLFSLSSCLPWKKKPKEEAKKEELRWAWSRPRRTTPRSPVTYTRRPYAAAPKAQPQQVTAAAVQAPKPAPIYLGRLKYKVVVLDFAEGEGTSEFKGIGKTAAERLRAMLAESGACVVIDREMIKGLGPMDDTEGLWKLWRALGVHGVIKGKIREAMVGEEKGGALALVGVEASLWSTETGQVVKGAYGQNPLYLSRTQGPARRLKALEKALKYALEEVRDGLLLGLGQMEWSTSVASVEGNVVYLNAGRRSGLKIGELLDVFAPGRQIRNPLTGAVIGRAPGERKAVVRVEEFFGLDASKAVLLEGAGVAPGDMAKPKKKVKGRS